LAISKAEAAVQRKSVKAEDTIEEIEDEKKKKLDRRTANKELLARILQIGSEHPRSNELLKKEAQTLLRPETLLTKAEKSISGKARVKTSSSNVSGTAHSFNASSDTVAHQESTKPLAAKLSLSNAGFLDSLMSSIKVSNIKTTAMHRSPGSKSRDVFVDPLQKDLRHVKEKAALDVATLRLNQEAKDAKEAGVKYEHTLVEKQSKKPDKKKATHEERPKTVVTPALISEILKPRPNHKHLSPSQYLDSIYHDVVTSKVAQQHVEHKHGEHKHREHKSSTTQAKLHTLEAAPHHELQVPEAAQLWDLHGTRHGADVMQDPLTAPILGASAVSGLDLKSTSLQRLESLEDEFTQAPPQVKRNTVLKKQLSILLQNDWTLLGEPRAQNPASEDSQNPIQAYSAEPDAADRMVTTTHKTFEALWQEHAVAQPASFEALWQQAAFTDKDVLAHSPAERTSKVRDAKKADAINQPAAFDALWQQVAFTVAE